MLILLPAAQTLVSLTFLVSGVAKALDRRATADAMVSLRLPAPGTHRLIASLLPVVEIVLALGVWLPLPVVPPVLGTLTLLLTVAYWVIIARALGFDEQVECSCFGSLGSPTVSRSTLARNSVLLVLAVLALVGAASGVPGEALVTAPWALLQIVLAVLVSAALALLTFAGARGAPSPKPSGTPDGTLGREQTEQPAQQTGDHDDLLDYVRTATPFGMLQREDEEPISLARLTSRRAALLVFVRPGCGPCERVLSAVPAWREDLEDMIVIRTLFRDHPGMLAASARERAGSTAAWDVEGNVARSLGASSSPAAVLLGADGMLAGGPVAGAEEVIDFVAQIVDQIAQTRAPDQQPPASPGTGPGSDPGTGPGAGRP